MNDKEFREFGKATIDYIANYNENLRDRDVLPTVQPGYLPPLLPKEAPEKPESWRQVLNDVEKFIMPGVSILLYYNKKVKFLQNYPILIILNQGQFFFINILY